MNRLESQQTYSALPSTEDIYELQQDVGIEIQPRPKLVASKASSTTYNSVDEKAQSSSNIFKRPWFSGWRVGTFLALLAVTISLIINVAVAIWLSKHGTFQGGLAKLTHGDCATIERLDTLVHLAINVLSTLILSGSNYTMQVLVGPTREDVNRAHRRGIWLDIGAPSLRNLRNISRLRVCLWSILLLSSFPLHLMFNSAFYSALTTNDYGIFVTTESFLSGADFDLLTGAEFDPSAGNIYSHDQFFVNIEYLQQEIHGFENLTNLDCINAYAQEFITNRRNLIIISSNSSKNSLLAAFAYNFSRTVTSHWDGHSYNPFDWICNYHAAQDYEISQQNSAWIGGGCSSYISYPLQHASEWAPWNYNAKYCLSERVRENCSFNANLPIIIIVIICNLLKVIVMVYVALVMRNDPLLVIGDAIASFLTFPDESTRQMCLLSREDVDTTVHKLLRWPTSQTTISEYPSDSIATADSRQRTWILAPSRGRRYAAGIILASCITVVAVLLMAGLEVIQNSSAAGIRDLGFGRVNSESLIRGDGWVPSHISSASGQILASIIIANIPQLLLSLLYFNVNSLLTVMLMADEWSKFVKQRKYLRVSHPVGNQRSTYFLQLPYRFAIPLMVLSILLHWLISRSIFLAVISEWNADGTPGGSDGLSAVGVATCGFSPLPIILTLSLGIVITIALMFISGRKYNAYIPVVGSCSAAIAAACHMPEPEEDTALQPLQWGVVSSREPSDMRINGWAPPGHCSFSSKEVTMPEAGKQYGCLPE